MASIGNIAGLHLQAGANNAPAQGVSAGAGGLMAFLNMLLGQASGAGGKDLTANIAALLKNDPNNTTSLTALLQKVYPNASADQLQQAVTQLESGASPVAIKPSLTSDLSASLAPGLQQEDPNILAQLQHRFEALTKDGPLTSDKIAQFRKDTIDFLKDKGLDNSSINQYLVTLSTDLGPKLPVALAAQLAMPLPQQDVASISAVTDDADTGTAPAQNKSHSSSPVSNGDNGDADEGDDEATGLQAETDGPATHDTTSLLLKPAAPRAPAPNDQPQGLQSEQKQQQGLNASADRAAPAAPALPQANAAPAAKPVSTAALHFFTMNNAQGGSDSFGDANDGQSGFQQMAGQVSVPGATATGAVPGSSNFVNYMSNASTGNAQAPQTVQNVALQIQQNASNGVTTFTMQLEPAELGRLEVRLKFDRDGGIKAHLIADKPETLSLLRQDASHIHRILQQTGLHADDGSLSFDLRQQGQQQNSDQSYNGAGQASAYNAGASASSDAIQANIAIQAMGTIRPGGINIMV